MKIALRGWLTLFLGAWLISCSPETTVDQGQQESPSAQDQVVEQAFNNASQDDSTEDSGEGSTEQMPQIPEGDLVISLSLESSEDPDGYSPESTILIQDPETGALERFGPFFGQGTLDLELGNPVKVDSKRDLAFIWYAGAGGNIWIEKQGEEVHLYHQSQEEVPPDLIEELEAQGTPYQGPQPSLLWSWPLTQGQEVWVRKLF